MLYESTRGGVTDVPFREVLFRGFAPDGGMFLPMSLPSLPWKEWAGLSYQEIVKNLMFLFVPDSEISHSFISEVVDRNYQPPKFESKNVAPIHTLASGNVHILELNHGPTWAFKDYSLTLVGELIAYVLEKTNKHVNSLVATSGDTGSAALQALRGKKNANIFVVYPGGGRISKVQEQQMISVVDENTFIYGADADSDQLDDIILRKIFFDNDFVSKYEINSVNSVNWARIMIQIAHWVYGYLALRKDTGKPLTIVAPTGACGNITAGLLAQKMGLPIHVVACTGPNDGVHKFLSTGEIKRVGAVKSHCNAMDIDAPYNIERILHLLNPGDVDYTAQFMLDFYQGKPCKVNPEILKELKKRFSSATFSDDQILETIAEVSKKEGYFLCPHTATAVRYSLAQQSGDYLCIATAAAHKFPETVKLSGADLPADERLTELFKRETKVKELKLGEDWAAIVRADIEQASQKWN